MKRVLSAILAALITISALTACGSAPTDNNAQSPSGSAPTVPMPTPTPERPVGEPQKGGVIKIALAASPKSLDPKNRTSLYESNIISQICDSLIIYSNDQSQYLPSLATSWTVSDDGLEYTFKLRDDVYFHAGNYQDGRKFVAEDVKYSLERAKTAKNVTLVMLDHVEVIDDTTVKCVLKNPDAIFMDALTGPTNMIVPKEEVEGWGDQFDSHLIGTGPFKLVEFKLDQETVLERNDKYWGPEPYLDGAVFKVVTDANQNLNGLKTGDLDFSTKISGEAVKLLQEDPNLVLLSQPNTSINFIGFNTEKGITADLRVRQALAEAVDVKELCAGMYQFGEAVYAGQPMPKSSWGYDPSMEAMAQKYDPEHAKKLLEEAGYKDGFKITINMATSPINNKLATILQQMWKMNLNVDLEIISTEWASYSETVTSGNHETYVVGVSSTVDPHNFTGKCLASKYIGTIPNGMRFNNKDMDALVEKSVATSDIAARKEVYKDIVKLAVENYPAIYLSNDNIIWGTNSKVHGLCQKTYWNLCNSEVNVWMEQ